MSLAIDAPWSSGQGVDVAHQCPNVHQLRNLHYAKVPGLVISIYLSIFCMFIVLEYDVILHSHQIRGVVLGHSTLDF